MPNQDALVVLISSLTKSEKRNFKILISRLGNSQDKLFYHLFEHIVAKGRIIESELFKKSPQIKKSQLSNIKSKLYTQILYSLRHLQRHSNIEMQVRELLDFAKVLYNKGLYKASLEMITKVKKIALEINDSLVMYIAVDFERKIESQYITGASPNKSDLISETSGQSLNDISITNEYANFSLKLYALYLKGGYVKNEEDYKEINSFFLANRPSLDESKLGFYDRIYLYQSYVWYYNMTQDFSMYYKYSQRWIDAFESNPVFIKNDTSLYLKGFHNCLNALYMADKKVRFNQLFAKYEDLYTKHLKSADYNTTSLFILFKNVHKLNVIFLKGDYDNGQNELADLEAIIEANTYHWDINRLLIFYYKIACIYFGADNYSKALDYLNKIINLPVKNIRLDIHCFARILCLITHFELGNDILVSYQVRSTYRFLAKIADLGRVQEEIFIFLRNTPKMGPKSIRGEFIALKEKLVEYSKDQYEKRPFLYLDIIGWLDSKIQGKRMQEIIKQRMMSNPK